MANIDNFYEILGLGPQASFEEIRLAYRQLVLQVHPDVAGSQAGAEFVRINRAYETLADPRRRDEYDRRLRESYRMETRRTPVSSGRVASPVFLNTLMAEVLDTMRQMVGDVAAGAGAAPAEQVEVQPLHILLVLQPEAAQSGTEVRLDLPVVTTCPNCRGTGLAEPFVCPACRGRGRWTETRAVQFFLAPPLRDGQIVTLKLRQADASIGQIRVQVQMSWM